jgi:hypothetical protein
MLYDYYHLRKKQLTHHLNEVHIFTDIIDSNLDFNQNSIKYLKVTIKNQFIALLQVTALLLAIILVLAFIHLKDQIILLIKYLMVIVSLHF